MADCAGSESRIYAADMGIDGDGEAHPDAMRGFSTGPESELADHDPNSKLVGMTLTAMQQELNDPPGGWTDEALKQLDFRYEIENGHLIVSASASSLHNQVSWSVKAVLQQQCPTEWWPIQDSDIRIWTSRADGSPVARSRRPDVLIVPSKLIEDRSWYHPHEVAVAVEIVSPGSQFMDRTTKVDIYAGWSIPLYLRLEIKPKLVLYSYALQSDGRYGVPIAHTDEFRSDEPFPLVIKMADLQWRR
jgi:Uma2 family endonuclease